MNFANDILDAMEIMVKQVVEDNATKIYTGVCKTIDANNCVLTINGKDNAVKYYGGIPVVGTVYQVFIPFGNMSAAFIIVPGSGGGSGGSGVDSVNGMTGEVVLSADDVGALPNTTIIPSKTSQLTNDSGYITASGAPVQSVDGETGVVITNAIKSTQQNLSDEQKAQARINIGAGTSSFDGNYSSLSGKPAIPSNTSQLNNDSGFITSENAPVKSVNNKTGEVVLSAADVGLSNVDNIRQYSKSNPPPYPVVSVNGKTGEVNLVANDVGAVSIDNITQTLGTSTTKVPSEKAVTDAMQAAGYGDMLKSVYDATGAIANGGGIVNYIKSSGFTFLGADPISSTSSDTTANWASLGTGYAWYDTAGLLINQPSRWGFVINYKYGGDIFQIWKTQNSGPMYYRSGDTNGWSKSWTKILDATDLIVSNTQPSSQAVGGIWYQTT